MNLKQTIFISLAVCTLVIGVHQSTITGFAGSYWIFMLMIVFIILYQGEKNRILKAGKAKANASDTGAGDKIKKSK